MALINQAPTLAIAPGALCAPPPTDPIIARLQQLAAASGLLLQPVVYGLHYLPGGQQQQQSLTPDTLDGPLIVTSLRMAETLTVDGNWQFQIQSGARRLCDGNVVGRLALWPPVADVETRALHAPIVVYRTDTLIMTITMPDGQVIDDAGVAVVGFHVRGPNGERLGAQADNFAELVRREGEFYAVGLADTRAVSQNIAHDSILERLVFAEGWNITSNLVDFELFLGNVNFTPQRVPVSVLNDAPSGQLVIDGIAWPARAGERAQLRPTYSGAGSAIQAVLLCRRSIG